MTRTRRPPAAPPLLLALALSGLAGCASGPEPPAPAVTEQQARDAVAGVVALAAQRTPEAMQRLCRENDGCPGMSSGAPSSPLVAPGPDDPPRELCVVALPSTPRQAGSRVVVLEGVDGAGGSYVTQVLVDRDGDGALVVQEPAFWLGIRYTALQSSRAWDAIVQGPGQPQAHDAETRRACTETDAWLTQVAPADDPGIGAASTG